MTTTESMDVAGRTLNVSISGSASPSRPPLLMCYGIGGGAAQWNPEFRSALGGATIAFDPPGPEWFDRGWTAARTSPMRQYAEAVYLLARELGHAKIDFLGLSWGGMLAQEFAHRHPGLIRRLVLASTNPGWMGVPARPAALRNLLSGDRTPARMERVAPTIFGGAFKTDSSLVHRLGIVREVDKANVRRQLRSIWGWTSATWLHQLRLPTLIMAGEGDPLSPMPNARLMAALIPQSRLHIVPDGGHLFVSTDPQGSAKVVRGFLDEPDADGRTPLGELHRSGSAAG